MTTPTDRRHALARRQHQAARVAEIEARPPRVAEARPLPPLAVQALRRMVQEHGAQAVADALALVAPEGRS